MNNEITEFLIDGESYYVLDKINVDNHCYLYLFNSDKPENFLIQEYQKGSDELLGVDGILFERLLQEFVNRHKK